MTTMHNGFVAATLDANANANSKHRIRGVRQMQKVIQQGRVLKAANKAAAAATSTNAYDDFVLTCRTAMTSDNKKADGTISQQEFTMEFTDFCETYTLQGTPDYQCPPPSFAALPVPAQLVFTQGVCPKEEGAQQQLQCLNGLLTLNTLGTAFGYIVGDDDFDTQIHELCQDLVPLIFLDGDFNPTAAPTDSPTHSPTTQSPTVGPTSNPTGTPTSAPTIAPTLGPTIAPTADPTASPTVTANDSANNDSDGSGSGGDGGTDTGGSGTDDSSTGGDSSGTDGSGTDDTNTDTNTDTATQGDGTADDGNTERGGIDANTKADSPNSEKIDAGVAAGIAVGASICLLCCCFIFLCGHRRRNNQRDSDDDTVDKKLGDIEQDISEADLRFLPGLDAMADTGDVSSSSPPSHIPFGAGAIALGSSLGTRDAVQSIMLAIDQANWNNVYLLSSNLAEREDLSTVSTAGLEQFTIDNSSPTMRQTLTREDQERAKTLDRLVANADWTGVAVTSALYAGESDAASVLPVVDKDEPAYYKPGDGTTATTDGEDTVSVSTDGGGTLPSANGFDTSFDTSFLAT
mmetsp:Transcript_16467/g.45984  ORF Transcript_16467/g.45984 Transcript_16467/m.45984 type:complete len:574 (+) Transcript_16467:2-1723(+)